MDKLEPTCFKILPTKVQPAARVHHDYWTEKYLNYVKSYNSMDIMETKLALQAPSLGFFLNSQMELKRLPPIKRT